MKISSFEILNLSAMFLIQNMVTDALCRLLTLTLKWCLSEYITFTDAFIQSDERK